MTDTDSLIYEVKTENFYKDIREDVRERFDTSNFPQNHSSGILRMDKKVPGMFKDECGGEITSEFCGLRAKLYASFTKDGEEEKRCKGVKKPVVSKSIHLEDYKRCLFAGKEEHRKMNVIRSREHELSTETVNKIALKFWWQTYHQGWQNTDSSSWLSSMRGPGEQGRPGKGRH